MPACAPSPYTPHSTFIAEVPPAFLDDICRAVVASYETAHAYCEDSFASAERHDLLPYYRRAMIEQSVAVRAARHPGVTVSERLNEAGNCHHRCVRIGRVSVTIHAVAGKGEVVREAKFRQSYARAAQLSLFGGDEPPPPDAPLYAVILHVPSDDQRRPAEVEVAFPNGDFTAYVGERIDLRRRFSHVFGGVEVADVPLPPPPPLRDMDKAGSE